MEKSPGVVLMFAEWRWHLKSDWSQEVEVLVQACWWKVVL